MNSEDLLAVYHAKHPERVFFRWAEFDCGLSHGAALELTGPTGRKYRFALRARRGVQIRVRKLAGPFRRKLKRWLR